MATDREVMQQALEALEDAKALLNSKYSATTMWFAEEITALRAATAEPEPEPVAAVAKNATAQFDHAIGADRFKVVRGPYWWHVLIGDSTKEHGKFHSRAGAEQMAADLLREFRNGAFVQHTAPPTRLAEPVACKPGLQVEVAEAVAWMLALPDGRLERMSVTSFDDEAEEMLARSIAGCAMVPLYTAPPQRKPLTDEEIDKMWVEEIDKEWRKMPDASHTNLARSFARAIERAQKITGGNDD